MVKYVLNKSSNLVQHVENQIIPQSHQLNVFHLRLKKFHPFDHLQVLCKCRLQLYQPISIISFVGTPLFNSDQQPQKVVIEFHTLLLVEKFEHLPESFAVELVRYHHRKRKHHLVLSFIKGIVLLSYYGVLMEIVEEFEEEFVGLGMGD